MHMPREIVVSYVITAKGETPHQIAFNNDLAVEQRKE